MYAGLLVTHCTCGFNEDIQDVFEYDEVHLHSGALKTGKYEPNEHQYVISTVRKPELKKIYRRYICTLHKLT